MTDKSITEVLLLSDANTLNVYLIRASYIRSLWRERVRLMRSMD